MDHARTFAPNDLAFLREAELADRWKTSRRTLQRWRALSRGPVWILIGGSVRYDMADILVFEKDSRRGRGADA